MKNVKMRNEYSLLLLSTLLHIVLPIDNESCKFPGKSAEGLFYDLNSLRGVQVVDLDTEPTSDVISRTLDRRRTYDKQENNMKLLFSICDSLASSPRCDENASACIITSDGKSYQENAGSSIEMHHGTIDFLSFEMKGAPCKNDTRQQFVIHFNLYCKSSEEYFQSDSLFALWSGPGSCEIFVDWMIEGSCGFIEGSGCSVHVEQNVTIDLTPLRSPTYYSVKDPSTNKSYQFNICGPIREGRCNGSVSLCEIDEGSNKVSVLGETMFAYYNRPVGIVVAFSKKDRGRVKAEVLLQCVPKIHFNPPIMSTRVTRKKIKMFILETPLACPIPPPMCLAVNEETGDTYSLYALAGQPLELNYGSSTMVVSVCGPIQKKYEENSPCSGPGFASCQIQNRKAVRVLGMVGQKPEVTKNETIRIFLPNGDLCPYSNSGERYKTYLDLFCDQTTGVKNKIEETGCDIFIRYVTPTACPSREVIGKDCKVQDSRYNFTFDLNPLRSPEDIIVPLNSSPGVRFNLCGPLMSPCNGVTNTSLCIYKNGSEHAVGAPATFPMFHDAMVKFDLYGPPCEEHRDFTKVTFMLACDHSAVKPMLKFIQFVPTQACHFYIVWKTNVACPPYSENTKCAVEDEKSREWFDLSSLSNPVQNQKVTVHGAMNTSADFDVYVNLCRSVIYGTSSPCPPYSGACIVIPGRGNPDTGTKDRYLSLGQDSSSGPFIDGDGLLKVLYRNGDTCEFDKRLNYTTRIIFVCDDSTKNGPVFIRESSTACHFEFWWRTNHACPASGEFNRTNGETLKASTCTTIDKYTNQSINLVPLRNQTWIISIPPPRGVKTLLIYLAICKRIPARTTKTYCGESAGLCIEDDNKTRMIGEYSEDLHWAGNQLFLSYENGRMCKDQMNKTVNTSAEISFMCRNEYFPRTGPQYVGSSGCKHQFIFYTSLVCAKNPLFCTVDTATHGEDADLSLMSLKQSTTPYRVESPDGHEFLINLCGPIPKAKNMGCKDDAAACMLHSEARSISERPVSLGYPSSRPILDHLPGVKKPQVVWKFTGGDPCPYSSRSNASASIRFMCDPSVGPGKPRYQGRTKDCVYQFSWNTSVVCLEEKVEFDRKSCILTNHGTLEIFNLTDLYLESTVADMKRGMKPPLTGENLYVYLCPWPQTWMNESSKTVECKDTAVCANVGDAFSGYGYQHFAYYDNSNSTVKIFFRGTYRHTCSDREVSGAEIWFPCAADRRFHRPKLLAATECHVVIEWPSPLMCGSKDLEHTFTIRTAWKTMGTLMFLALFSSLAIYVVRKTNCWPWIRTRINRAMGYKHSSLVTYTAEPQEEWTEFETLNE